MESILKNVKVMFEDETKGIPFFLFTDEENEQVVIVVNSKAYLRDEEKMDADIVKSMQHLIDITPSDIIC